MGDDALSFGYPASTPADPGDPEMRKLVLGILSIILGFYAGEAFGALFFLH